LGAEARALGDQLQAARQSWWQVLPLVPPSGGSSPYNSSAAFATNPLLIDLRGLVELGLLSPPELNGAILPVKDKVDFGQAHTVKMPLLERAHARLRTQPASPHRAALEAWAETQSAWLEDYAMFLVDVMQHFDQQGLHFDYLSPFNEPQWNWDDPGQEGTPALNVELYALVCYLSRELSQRKLSAQLVLGEAGTIGHALKVMDNDGRDDQARVFFSPESPFYVGALPHVARTISAHDYHSVWPLDKLVEYRHLLRGALTAVNPELGYWQSEYCILEGPNNEVGGGGKRDLGMDTALYIARIIHADMTVACAKSWQWWTALSQVDFKDGLVYLDDGSQGSSGLMGPETLSLMNDGVVRESKLLWTLGNYARFVRPGMVRVKCSIEPEQSYANGVLSSAYKGSGGDVTVVLVNLGQEEACCNLGFSQQVDVFTTSSTANLQKSRQNSGSITLPARAVGTCVLRLPLLQQSSAAK
ncbi:MAG: 4-alpha-glucanotransferase, partial [Verrucomicrobia bacterium]|nr:4-alpha-glucanotransferase [Verrucomicrobiota bacterium]